MYKVPATDSVAVSISTGSDHCKRRIGSHHTRGGRQYATMQCMVSVTPDIILNKPRTTYAGKNHGLVWIYRKITQRLLQGGFDTKMAAA
jgi:hypothetical protein